MRNVTSAVAAEEAGQDMRAVYVELSQEDVNDGITAFALARLADLEGDRASAEAGYLGAINGNVTPTLSARAAWGLADLYVRHHMPGQTAMPLRIVEGLGVEPYASHGRALAADLARQDPGRVPGTDVLCCSYCGRESTEVRLLIKGPQPNICDRCVDLAEEALAEEALSGPPTSTRGTPCGFCGQDIRDTFLFASTRTTAMICGDCLSLAREIINENR